MEMFMYPSLTDRDYFYVCSVCLVTPPSGVAFDESAAFRFQSLFVGESVECLECGVKVVS